MEDAAIIHFALPVFTRIENHFLIGGLGVEDQQNGLRVGLGQGGSPTIKTEKIEWGKKNWDTVPQLLFIS